MNDYVLIWKLVLSFAFIVFAFIHIYMSDHSRRVLHKGKTKQKFYTKGAIVLFRFLGIVYLWTGFFYTALLKDNLTLPVMIIPAGLILAGLGGYFIGWALYHIKLNAFVGGNTLITRGPYRLVRHPIYFRTLTFFVGGSLMFSSIFALFYTLITFVFVYFLASIEENELRLYFKDKYDKYAENTPMLIPIHPQTSTDR